MTSLQSQLRHRVVHRLPHFERHYELGAPYILSFRDIDCRDWHAKFANRIIAAVGTRQHLPVYRISHGEFIMAVGYQAPVGASLRSRLVHHFVQCKRWIGLAPSFYSGSQDNSYETFTKGEISRARAIYVSGLRNIANEGILAIAFNENRGFIEYIPKYLRWLERQQICLNADNYMPFYSIYALLLGPESEQILRGRHVLVITSFTPEKQAHLQRELQARGVKSVQCYAVSPTRAMFDIIDLERIRQPVDVVLIGAGVGAASIIEQIKALDAVAIDSGFAIDVIAYREKRWNRPFCVADSEFDLRKITFLEPSDVEMLAALNAAQGKKSELLEAYMEAAKSTKSRSN